MTITVVIAFVGLLFTAGIFLYNRRKDQKAEEGKRQADSEKRVFGVVEKYRQNRRSDPGISGLVRAGAALLHDENEILDVISQLNSMGDGNPLGPYFEGLKEKKNLIRFLKKSAEYTSRPGQGTMKKSPEDIIKMLEDEKS